MYCAEWTRLFELRENAAQEYNQAIDAACGLNHVQFEGAIRKLELAKQVLESVEKSMLDHEQGHGCLRRRRNALLRAG